MKSKPTTAQEKLDEIKDSLELLTDNDIDQHKLEAAIDMAARIGAEAVLEAVTSTYCDGECDGSEKKEAAREALAELCKAQEL